MPTAVHRPATKASRTRLARRLAATAGAVGAAASATTTEAALVYVPTSGVAAAQNIPGFSFTAPSTVVPGTLRPPTTTGTTLWDIDGEGNTSDFILSHSGNLNTVSTLKGNLIPAGPVSRPSGLIITNASSLIRAEATNPAASIGLNLTGAVWRSEAQPMTQFITSTARTNRQPNFPDTTPKQFGFRFATPDASGYYYGWGTLEIDLSRPGGSGYTISEAFYQTTPGSPITVGAVPVPEPAGLALLALGATGLAAWRARRS